MALKSKDKAKNIYDLSDIVFDVNESNKKKLKDKSDKKEDKAPKKITISPKLSTKMLLDEVESLNRSIAEREGSSKVNSSFLSPIDVNSIESKLNLLAKERKQEEEKKEKKDKKEKEKSEERSSKKNKKKRDKKIRQMFASINSSVLSQSDEEDEDSEISLKESNEGTGSIKLNGLKNKIIKNTEGTSLDTPLGLRFSPILAMQMEEIEYMGEMIEFLKDDIKTSPSKNMYRSSQTSNLLSALGHRRSLMKDVLDTAKAYSDFELKHLKEERANKDKEEKGDMSNIAKVGASLIRGLYDDDIKDIKKKKKKDKKKKYDDDDDDEDTAPSKKDRDRLIARASRNIILSDYEENIDLEGKYEVAVVADKEDPKSDWKFILINDEGKRMKKWEEERPNLLPSKKRAKMSFAVEKLKAIDNVTRRSYKLILK